MNILLCSFVSYTIISFSLSFILHLLYTLSFLRRNQCLDVLSFAPQARTLVQAILHGLVVAPTPVLLVRTALLARFFLLLVQVVSTAKS
jgi:hypothetical protein